LTGHHCADVNFEETKVLVKTAGGGEEWIEGDVIIAADGIKSIMREKMLSLSGLKDEGEFHVDCSAQFRRESWLILCLERFSSGRATGDAAYRIIIPREKLESDPELLELVNEKVGIRWMGPG
jgi:salicylate hydroxylase